MACEYTVSTKCGETPARQRGFSASRTTSDEQQSGNLERAGVPRPTAMAMIGHKTEFIYRRYSIVDQAMLEICTAKLDALQQIQRTNRAVVVSMGRKGKIGWSNDGRFVFVARPWVPHLSRDSHLPMRHPPLETRFRIAHGMR